MDDLGKYSDQQLVALLRDGNTYAYTAIYERYKALLYKHAYNLLGDEVETEDVLHDVFLAIWDKREQLKASDTLSAYLYKAVRNRIFNLMAHREVIGRYADSIRAFAREGCNITDERVREKELLVQIEREIANLPPKMREVFLMSREKELSYKEIGEQLNISEKTVRQQVYNAVKTLKGKIRVLIWMFF